jgi:iron complex transport system substrate-binding protein
MPCGFHLPETVQAWAGLGRPAEYAELAAVRRDQVFALDGSAYFSRPGPRVIDGIELLAEIFDPQAFVEISPLGSWTPVKP